MIEQEMRSIDKQWMALEYVVENAKEQLDELDRLAEKIDDQISELTSEKKDLSEQRKDLKQHITILDQLYNELHKKATV